MLSQKKILVVEDNKINRMMLCNILSPTYTVLEAENGQEALDVLKTYGERISLILLDIIMPIMDGYTFLSHVKATPDYTSIPVIVTTQNDAETDEVAALSYGAMDFVTKPYRPKVILHRAANIINLRETAAMVNMIRYDRLTGLYGKEFFYQQVKEALLNNPDRAYDILCSDIENFKLINDVFGVPAGDVILRGIADMYTKKIGAQGICGRFNADQFVCLIERPEEYTDQFFWDANAQIHTIPNAKNIVMKWGVYSITDRTLSVEQICDRALLAARSIKGQYGKHFATYDDTLRNRLLREQAITDSMESALAEEQFEVYLQPKYSVKDDALSGAEALVRWNHPEWGIQSPFTFIPLFEKNGFITKLDQFVWDKTCSILHDWDEAGYPPIDISVNVSRADIYHADLVDILTKTVKKYDLSPTRLHLEVTESAYTENPSQIINTVSCLRKQGFIIEMDDFGSGYSSLNMLTDLPIDVLKLDMKFIQNETAKPNKQGILRFIINLARWMSLSVVAEGVETKEQLDHLREVGCDYVQGYYFAKPMPYRDFEPLLKEQHVVSEQDMQDSAENEASAPQQTLLIIDEDAAYRNEVKNTFENSYKVVEADDRELALNYITSYKDELAVIILSLTLPHEDGFSVLKTVQGEKSIWDIPIIATAPSDAQVERKAFDMGVDDFASKPHLQQSLHKRVLRTRGIAVMRERERILQNEVYRDYLTGLLNQRGLDIAVLSLRKQDAPLAVYLFHSDYAKYTNEDFNHEEYNQFIIQFVSFLRSHIRDSDILARIGDDEFIVIMKQMQSERNAIKKGDAICQTIRTSRFAKKTAATYSVGITMWDTQDPIEQVIKQASQALHCAQAKDTHKCCLWRGDTDKTSNEC